MLLTEVKDEEFEVWRVREEIMRGVYGAVVNWKEDEREEREERLEEGNESGADAKSAFVASAAAVVVGAFILRLGGRAALVSVLGLDVVADLGLGDQINDVVSYANALGGWAVVGFFMAWVVAKVFLLDVVGIALAFASGIIFGGVFEGAAISALGATFGSLVAFGLSRTLLQEKVEEAIEKQPVARALAKVVEEDGFKTVFVLRLAPILPIPLGAYSYVYGTSKLNPLIFAAATGLGSIKPYLVDSYLGVFSKQLIDGDLDSSKDIVLLVGLGVLVLVGVFATDLAGESWDRVQLEMAADERKRVEAGVLTEEEEGQQEGWDGMIGPLNASKPVALATGLVPVAAREEVAEAWLGMNDFLDYQWAGGVRRALAAREKRAAEAAAAEAGTEKGNSIERLLGSLATPAEEAQSEGGGGGIFGGDPFPDDASEGERRERRRVAAWSTEGGAWRGAATSLLFTFAVLNAARGKWTTYPADREALEAVGRGDMVRGRGDMVRGDASQTLTDGVPLEAPAGEGGAATVGAISVSELAISARSREAEIEAELALIDTQLQRTAQLAERQSEIAARLAEIDAQLRKPLVDPAVRQQQIEARLAQIDEQLTENTDTAAR